MIKTEHAIDLGKNAADISRDYELKCKWIEELEMAWLHLKIETLINNGFRVEQATTHAKTRLKVARDTFFGKER